MMNCLERNRDRGKMSDLISIVIPVYNVERYVERCIDSVRNQTYKNIEIIIVDDGSPDSSGEICDEIAKDDSRIQVIHQKNAGLSGARNTGIAKSSGKYILFIDSDDWIESDFVFYLHYLITKYNADIAQCDFKYIDENGKIYNSVTNTQEEICCSSKDALQRIMAGNQFITSAWGKIYKRKMFDTLQYPVGKIFEDIPVTYEAFLRSNKIVYGNRALYNYLYNKSGISNAPFSEKRLSALFFSEAAVKKVVTKFPDLREEGFLCLFRMNFAIYIEINVSEENRKYLLEIRENIKETRKYVLKSKTISYKWKIKALTTYFGHWLPRKLFLIY